MRIFPAILLTLTFLPVGITAQEEKKDDWSVDTANPEGTPVVQFDHVAEEGTWISLDVSPDGEFIAFDLLGHIYEMPADGGEATALTSGRSWNLIPRYSPDGREIAFTSDRGGSEDIWVLNRDTGELTNFTQSPSPVVRGEWTADGRHIMAARITGENGTEAHLFNRYGKSQQLAKAGLFQFLQNYVEDPERNAIYYERNDGQLPGSGPRIYQYDRETGEAAVMIDRPGGAFNPALSPDGSRLAFMGRDDLETVLFVRDMAASRDRILLRGLDRDQMENPVKHLGTAPAMSWMPGGGSIVLSKGGKIHRVDVATGEAAEIPFRATVSRELNETIRFKADIPQGAQRTQVNRWGIRTEAGVISETLGDLYLLSNGGNRNLTDSPDHESSPVYDAEGNWLYYASWNDEDFGAIYRKKLNRSRTEKLTDFATQYGGLALSSDGKILAYIRGRGDFGNGMRLENQVDFELMIRGADGSHRKLADINANWSNGNTPEIRRTPGLTFSPDGATLYYSEYDEDGLIVRSVSLDGRVKRDFYRLPNATRAIVSPGLQWLAFREYHRSYITPFEFAGKPVSISAEDGQGFTKRIHKEDGAYLTWSADSQSLSWMRGATFYEKNLTAILNDAEEAETTDLAIEYTVAVPDGIIALTNARILTMNAGREVLENASILINGNRIEAVGPGLDIPGGAQVYDLEGRTIMPGIVDAHAHYGGVPSYLHVIEQRVSGLLSPLAHGVTTMYEVYGTQEKDFWLVDMLRKGDITGPRLFSTGTPIYGSPKFRLGLYRSIKNYEDAYEHLAYNKAFGATAVKDYAVFNRRARHGIATAGRELGLNVVAESAALLQMNLTQIVDGETGIEHSMGMTPLYGDVAAMFAASDIGITPTLIVVYNGPAGEGYFHRSERVWENEKLRNFMRKEELLTFRRPQHIWADEHYAPEMAASLRKLYQAGVSLQMGAHGQMPGLDAHWEMELFAQGGFTPAEVLEIATINGAVYHGLGNDLGSIEPGKLADLVIMTENPLDDVRNARTIEYVMKNGALYSGNDAARIYPDPEPAKPIYIMQK